MKGPAHLRTCVAIAAAGLAVAACGGGGNSGTSPSTPPTATATTAGVWTGTIASTVTGQAVPVVALTAQDGHSVWMAADGRVWSGDLPLHGDHFEAAFASHMYEGARFPDGTNHGTTSMRIDHHSAAATQGQHSGCGDAGSFDMRLSPMWSRPASLPAVAGVYTRSTSSGYTMTMTLHADGQLSAADSFGCVMNGTVEVADATHNLYHVHATVGSCGTLDGEYHGTGTLLDADAMRTWMTAMHPLEHGGHSHGGMHGMGQNTVPGGDHNLFMFSMVNDRGAIMDALAR